MLGAAYAPRGADDPVPDSTGAGTRLLQEAAISAVLPALRRPSAKDRLLGYGILLKLWATHKWLADGDGPEDAAGWQPHQELLSLAAGDGGYLAPVLALLD